MRLDFVSPLPPVRSGIADYSRDLLPHLAPLCDLRVLALPGQPVAEELVRRWRPVAASAAPAERLALYQMGNNRFHDAVWDLAEQRPGILTLHDLVLHHLLRDRTLGRDRLGAYRSRLIADHGWVGEVASLPARWGGHGEAAIFALPAHRTLLRSQRGVLVHSEWAARRLRAEDPDLRVAAVPMGVPLPAPLDRRETGELRRRFGVPEGALLVGSLGFQTPIKRTGRIIAALTRPELATVHLLVGGEVAPVLDLEGEARRAGIAERVHLTGFLEGRAYELAIGACDICVNLRYPSAGETSASLLRVLAHGRPALVSDYAQFALLPDDIVVKVPLGEEEPERIASALARLDRAPETRAAFGERARRYVAERHRPEDAARAIVDACRDWSSRQPPREAPPRPARPTSRTWGPLAAAIEVFGATSPWRAGERRRLVVRLTNRGFARWLPAETGTGGVAISIQLRGAAAADRDDRPWFPLEREVPPGDSLEIACDVRRPLGPARLLVEARALGRWKIADAGEATWEREI